MSRKPIRIPPLDEGLAEFIGIFLGDGGYRSAWQLTISFNIHGDRPYAEFIDQRVESLFGIKATWHIREYRGSGDLLISSVALVEFLESMGLRLGAKARTQPIVPDWILTKREYRVACLRGLMDTDGSIYRHRYRVGSQWYEYPKLAFCSVIPGLRAFVKTTMRELAMSPYHNPTSKQVFVSSRANVARYFQIVGTSNPRYQQRFLTIDNEFVGEVAEWSKAAVC